jgi:hypothetical protein
MAKCSRRTFDMAARGDGRIGQIVVDQPDMEDLGYADGASDAA